MTPTRSLRAARRLCSPWAGSARAEGSGLSGGAGPLRRWLAALGLCAAAALPLAAQADVWGFVDAQGVAHFAAEQLDERYEIFYRGGESFDTGEGVSGARPAAILVPTPAGALPARLASFFETSPRYRALRPLMQEAADRHDIDYALLQALIATESGFNPAAVSPKGAVGLMQLMPATAARYGVAGDHRATADRKLVDPATNIRAGSRYLRDLIDLFSGELELALAAYNAGEGAVQRAGNRIPNYRETQNYVKTVMQLYGLLQPAPAAAGPARAAAQSPTRVRMELPGANGTPVPGTITGRGNLPAPLRERT